MALRAEVGAVPMIAIAALIKDLRAVGIPYEPDLTWPPPVRHRTALYIALGHLCKRPGSGRTDDLRQRTSAALRWIKALGRRSRWASWFERDF